LSFLLRIIVESIQNLYHGSIFSKRVVKKMEAFE